MMLWRQSCAMNIHNAIDIGKCAIHKVSATIVLPATRAWQHNIYRITRWGVMIPSFT